MTDLPRLIHNRRQFIARASSLASLTAANLTFPSLGLFGSANAATTGLNLHSYDAKNNDYWLSWAKGAEEACKALGMNYAEAISDYDISKQKSAFENAGTQGVKTASIVVTDEGGSEELIRTLTKQGILVVNFNANAPWNTPLEVDPLYIQFLSVSNYFGAYAMAKSLFDKMGGKGTLVHLQGVVGLSHDTERTQGLDDALKEYPNIKLVARQPGKYNRVDGQAVFEQILTREGNVDAVFCQNDDSAVGVLNVLKQTGKSALVAGIDGIAEWLDLIATEAMAYGTWAFHPRYGSAMEVVALYDALNGWKPSLGERFMGYGSVIIDTPAAAKKYREVVFADQSPWDYKLMSKTLNPDSWDMQVPVFTWDPNIFWAQRQKEKPAGYNLPADYASVDYAKTDAMYAERFKKDPLAEVISLTNFGNYVTK